ncbi:SRPBCC domain-containing protein [Paenibacillus aurantius]|uniref:SRPBCC domain-containing protein n=1 Tax=Paenibacillus aurantius TaxID=2918900 RepID=A0AA96RE11_9BACL|nr:SRPBCC domain-containing protein [Paenibacillus aurantius]WJH37247.1 SRPBCC domain-containing protein [Paenibacillus sp. CC-CFT747]WNQ10377.1 SRPBCC domain-containing protein [Paenibacillus aurantius]
MSVTYALEITREFAAPRDLVFKAWTEPERLAKWWGPKGFTLEVKQLDLRPGGMFLGSQRSPEGHVMWGKFVYQEITPPEKLVYIQSFSDEEGNTIRAPFSPVWPLEILNDLTLIEHEGKTTVTFKGGPVNASPEELQAFEGMKPMVQEGFKGTFDQLDAYLAEQR